MKDKEPRKNFKKPRPEEQDAWVKKQFAQAQNNPPFVQAIVDGKELDYANAREQEDRRIKRKIEKRTRRNKEYDHTAFVMQWYAGGSYATRVEDSRYGFWEGKEHGVRQALEAIKQDTPKEKVIVELEELLRVTREKKPRTNQPSSPALSGSS